MEHSKEKDKKRINNKTLKKIIEKEVVPLIKKYIQNESEEITSYAKAISEGIIEILKMSEDQLTDELIRERLMDSLDDEFSGDMKTAERIIEDSLSENEIDKLISIFSEKVYESTESNLLTNIDEFIGYKDVLDEQGINTVEDFLGFTEYNPEGIQELLGIDDEDLDKLIDAAKMRLSEEELKELEETEIKEIGKDYKLGLRLKEEEE